MKDELKNGVMHRVQSMGMNVPRLWKDELFQNELTKLDIKREITRNETLQDPKAACEFNLDHYNYRYFDKKKLTSNFQNFKKVLFEENRTKYQRMSEAARREGKSVIDKMKKDLTLM